MNGLSDYAIIQRDGNGFGRAVFSGACDTGRNKIAVARVVSETDNSVAVPWTLCEKTETGFDAELVIPEGGLYTAEVRESEGEFDRFGNRYDWGKLVACARHIGVGDIFIMAGQSNMSGYAKDPAYDPPEYGVHLYDNSGRWTLASHPLNSVPDPVYRNNDPNSAVSPGLVFGKRMKQALGVPVGLISAAQGGTPLRSWNPAEEDCYLFREMVRKVAATGGAAGMIWYQGCNETGDEAESRGYLGKFTQTVSLWRETLGNIPVITCQLNRHAWKDGGSDRNWGLVREAQRQAALAIGGVSVVPTLDLGTSDGIHNSSASCIVIGERLAKEMLRTAYGFPGTGAPSVKRAVKVSPSAVRLEFYEDHCFRTMDDTAEGIDIEDEKGLTPCVRLSETDGGLLAVCDRNIGKNAVFHAYWRREQPAFFARDNYGMPMLSCYGVKIEDE